MSKLKSRREVLKNIGFMSALAISSPTLLSVLQSCSPAEKGLSWTPKNISLDAAKVITQLSNILIPKTDTPGALEAGVPAYIDVFYKELLNEKETKTFDDGIKSLENSAKTFGEDSFTSLNKEQQNQVFSDLMKANTNEQGKLKGDSFPHLIRYMVLSAYCTSEMGATQALAYLPVPGKWEACIPADEHTKTWAL